MTTFSPNYASSDISDTGMVHAPHLNGATQPFDVAEAQRFAVVLDPDADSFVFAAGDDGTELLPDQNE